MHLGRFALFLTFFLGISASAQAQYTTKTAPSGFTKKTSDSPSRQAPKPAAAQAKPTSSQPVFRPRPQAVMEMPEDDDELPSFEALEKGKNAAGDQASAAPLPPPPAPKGEIWFYISDFAYRDRTGMTMNCDWKVVVQNRTDMTIEQFDIGYQLLDLNFILYSDPIAAGASTVTDHATFSEKCPAMTRVKPKITIEKCKIGALTGQSCLSYIVVK